MFIQMIALVCYVVTSFRISIPAIFEQPISLDPCKIRIKDRRSNSSGNNVGIFRRSKILADNDRGCNGLYFNSILYLSLQLPFSVLAVLRQEKAKKILGKSLFV